MINLLKKLFRGRTDAYGAYGSKNVKETLSNEVFKNHVRGKIRLGIYPLAPDILEGAGVWFAAADIDTDRIEFVDSFIGLMELLNLACYAERSKSKGYHTWLFFDEPVPAVKARALIQYGLDEVNSAYPDADIKEIFPKQASLNDSSFGNFINIPMFGSDIENSRTVFLNPNTDYKAYPDQIQVLKSIKKISLDQVDQIIADEHLPIENVKSTTKPTLIPDQSVFELEDKKLKVYQTAVQMPYIKSVLRKSKRGDQSESDYAFLKSLTKEGIRDKEILAYALEQNPDSKWNRDRQVSYLRSIINSVIGDKITLNEGRCRLEKDFEEIDLEQKDVILVNPPIASGKTYQAIKLIKKAVSQGIRVMMLVPLHSLANEIIDELNLPAESIAHLYGITHEEVGCPHRQAAFEYLRLGHSSLFKIKLCNKLCEKYDECLYQAGIKKSRNAEVLIGTHAHGIQGFFSQKNTGNQSRELIIFDEMPKNLVKKYRLTKPDLEDNLDLFKLINRNGEFETKPLESIAENLLKDNKVGKIPFKNAQIGSIGYEQIAHINKAITDFYRYNELRPNLLWQLYHILTAEPDMHYERDTDSFWYAWQPDIQDRKIMFLSATTSSKYLSKILSSEIKLIGSNYQIARDNLKIVQLPNVMTGRTRSIFDTKLQDKIKHTFKLILQKHRDQRIALIVPLGQTMHQKIKEHIGANTTFKQFIIDILKPIAEQFNRELLPVSSNLNQIPSGLLQIPVAHYGIIGINKFSDYEVVVETTPFYYPPEAIKDAVKINFNEDIETTATKQKTSFRTDDGKIDVTRKIYDDELARMQVQNTQVADMQQTEGRFLRHDKKHKTVYRLHGVNHKPYPHRFYYTWQTFWKYEFSNQIPDEDKLTKQQLSVWNFLKKHDKFSPGIILQAFEIHKKKISRLLNKLQDYGYIRQIQAAKGRYQKSIYEVVN